MSTHYELRPVHSFGPVLGGGTPRADEANWNGSVPFITPTELSGLDGKEVGKAARSVTETGVPQTTVIESGVLVSCRAPIGSIGTTTSRVSFNQGCKGIPVSDEQQARYLAYALVAARETLESRGNGTTFSEISSAALGQVRIPAPPLETQRAIADYLDRETAEVDAMSADLDEMEALLTERRGATIGHFMDLASVHGRIPLGYVAATVAGATPSTSTPKYWANDSEGGYPWAAIGDMSSVPVVMETQKRVSKEGVEASRLTVAEPGAVLFAMYGATLGAVSRLGISACWNQAILGIFPDESRLTSDFLESALIALRPGLERLHRGNTQNNLNAEQVKGMSIPLPPLDVQRDLTRRIAASTAEIDSMLADITELRDLLAERRAAVIAAAVTGQIDVSTIQETNNG